MQRGWVMLLLSENFGTLMQNGQVIFNWEKSWYINTEGSGDSVIGKNMCYFDAEGSGDAVIGPKLWYIDAEVSGGAVIGG